jgi:hypothetical protein
MEVAPIELTLPGSFGGALALLTVYGLCLGMPLLVAAVALRRALALGALARAAGATDERPRSEPSGAPPGAHARFHWRWVGVLVFALAVSQPGLVSFHRDAFRGRAVVGSVVSKQLIVGVDRAGNKSRSALLFVRPPSDVSRSAAPRMLLTEVAESELGRVDVGSRVWLRVVAGAPSDAHLGRTATCETTWLLKALLACLGVALYALRARRLVRRVVAAPLVEIPAEVPVAP